MNKKKKIIVAVILIVALAMSFIGGQTYSKYMTQVHGVGGAEVAKWNFKVNGSESYMETINLMQTCREDTLTNGKIAPGTSGYFDLVIDAQSAEVGISYKIDFGNVQGRPQNLNFIYNGLVYSSLEQLSDDLKGNIYADDNEKIKVFTIDWVWAYEQGTNDDLIAQNDKIDTADGSELTNFSFDIIVTGTQMMPTN